MRKILVYDIETIPLKAWTFRLGKQVVTHSHLDQVYSKYDIISISYCFNDGKGPKVLSWGFGAESSNIMLAQFDRVIQKAQKENVLIIGKNNKSFDDKHINTQRWLNNHPAMPEWIKYTDDLETQLRRHFYLPSYSLDYVSAIKGLGGKIKMELKDWINICNYKKAKILIKIVGHTAVSQLSNELFGHTLKTVLTAGEKSLKLMLKYNKKDVKDTLAIILDVAKHCEFKSNVLQYKGTLRCKNPLCGSTNIKKNGTRTANGVQYYQFYCNEHGGYAGKATQRKDGSFNKLI